MSRDDQISRVTKDIHDMEDVMARKDKALQKFDVDLMNAEEDRRKAEDIVSTSAFDDLSVCLFAIEIQVVFSFKYHILFLLVQIIDYQLKNHRFFKSV